MARAERRHVKVACDGTLRPISNRAGLVFVMQCRHCEALYTPDDARLTATSDSNTR